MQMSYIYITVIISNLNLGDMNGAILCLLYVNALPSNLFCHQTSNFSISATCANQHSEYELKCLAYILMPRPPKQLERRLHERRFVNRKSNGYVELHSKKKPKCGAEWRYMCVIPYSGDWSRKIQIQVHLGLHNESLTHESVHAMDMFMYMCYVCLCDCI